MDLETASPEELIEECEAEVKETFSDGGRWVKISGGGYHGPDLPEGVKPGHYYVPETTPDGFHDWLKINGSYRHNERQRKAQVMGRLVARTDCLARAGETVPVSVATESNKAIAAYLWAVKGWDKKVIANKMEKAESTITQYLSDYKSGRTD